MRSGFRRARVTVAEKRHGIKTTVKAMAWAMCGAGEEEMNAGGDIKAARAWFGLDSLLGIDSSSKDGGELGDGEEAAAWKEEGAVAWIGQSSEGGAVGELEFCSRGEIMVDGNFGQRSGWQWVLWSWVMGEEVVARLSCRFVSFDWWYG
ncbi:hypothetical protein M0R45_001689 [Rubus argutus]|uniref:Uncharacterized protein n=1 Tax=Rubus argutus TaxID=59490 RepID=A0AAW1VME2_RUBAR